MGNAVPALKATHGADMIIQRGLRCSFRQALPGHRYLTSSIKDRFWWDGGFVYTMSKVIVTVSAVVSEYSKTVCATNIGGEEVRVHFVSTSKVTFDDLSEKLASELHLSPGQLYLITADGKPLLSSCQNASCDIFDELIA